MSEPPEGYFYHHRKKPSDGWGPCSSCRFWCPIPVDAIYHECRAHPPKVRHYDEPDLQLRARRGSFPLVHETDWCGEWEGVRHE